MKIKQIRHKFTAWLRKDKRRATMLFFVALFAVVGIITLLVSRAATPSVAIGVEAESGTTSGSARVISDSAASGGKAILFEQVSTLPPIPETWADHTGIFMSLSGANDGQAAHDASVARINKAKELGVGWIKFSWEQNWGTYDDSLTTYAHSLGMKVQETCQKTPHSYTTADVASFATYCAAWATKTGTAKIDSIEIGNEWNNHSPFWTDPDTTYKTQAALFDATAAAIRAKNPTITIISAGWSSETSPNLPVEAETKSLDNSNGQFKANANAIGMHPYAYNCDTPLNCGYPGRKDWNTFLSTLDVYAAAKARGFDHPVWFTEIGGPSGGGNNLYTGKPFTPATQAQLFTDYIAGVKYLRNSGVPIGVVFWGTIQDGQNATIPVENNFGLFDSNWNIKPAGAVVKAQSSLPW